MRHHSVRLVVDYEKYRKRFERDMDSREAAHNVWTLSGGNLKQALAILLFLNRTRKIQVVEEIGMKAMVPRPNHPKVLLAHSVIRMSADPVTIVKDLCANESVFRRLHDVRGHFCHDKVARESSCEPHEWEESEDSSDKHLRWSCKLCKGKRWWRHEHRRGHEDAGLVTSEYRVTK
jgi:hypothetical protein